MDILKASITGTKEALEALKQFNVGIQRKHTKIALAAAGGVIKPTAIANAPTDSGSLKKTLIVKTKLGKKKDYAYTIIGPSRALKFATSDRAGADDVFATFRKVKKKTGEVVEKVTGAKKLAKAEKSQTIRYRKPARYAHLIEKGSATGTKATNFMARALATKKNEAGQKAIAKLRQGVEEEAAKALAKSK